MALITTFNRLKREVGIKKCVIIDGNVGDVYLNEKKQIVDLIISVSSFIIPKFVLELPAYVLIILYFLDLGLWRILSPFKLLLENSISSNLVFKEELMELIILFSKLLIFILHLFIFFLSQIIKVSQV